MGISSHQPQACAEREEQYRPKLLVKPAEKKIPPPAPAPVEAQPALPQAPEQPPLPSVPAESDSDSDGHMSDAPPEPMPDMEDSPSQGGDYESTTLHLVVFICFVFVHF